MFHHFLLRAATVICVQAIRKPYYCKLYRLVSGEMQRTLSLRSSFHNLSTWPTEVNQVPGLRLKLWPKSSAIPKKQKKNLVTPLCHTKYVIRTISSRLKCSLGALFNLAQRDKGNFHSIKMFFHDMIMRLAAPWPAG